MAEEEADSTCFAKILPADNVPLNEKVVTGEDVVLVTSVQFDPPSTE